MDVSPPVERLTPKMGEALEDLHEVVNHPYKADKAVVDICLVLLGERDCATIRQPNLPENEVSLDSETLIDVFDALNLFVVGQAQRKYGLDEDVPVVEFFLYPTYEEWHEYRRNRHTEPLARVNAKRFGIPDGAAEAFLDRQQNPDAVGRNGATEIRDDLVDSGEFSQDALEDLIFAKYRPELTREGVCNQFTLAQERGKKLDALATQSDVAVLDDALHRLREFSFALHTSDIDEELPEYPA